MCKSLLSYKQTNEIGQKEDTLQQATTAQNQPTNQLTLTLMCSA